MHFYPICFRKTTVTAIFALAAVASQAQVYQGSSVGDYLGGGNGLFGSDISLTWGSQGNIAAGSITAGAYGFLRWRDTSSGDFSANGLGYGTPGGTSTGTFNTLCGQFVYLNDPSNFDVWDISAGAAAPPLPSYRSYTLFRGASVFSHDFDGVNPATGTAFQHAFGMNNATYGAAIQLAVWAAIYGDGSSWDLADYNTGTNVLTLGSFVATDTDSLYDTIIPIARNYYEAARMANWTMGNKATSFWLDSLAKNGSGIGQDQFTIDPTTIPQSVPEPFTMALGIAGAGAYIRKRMKKTSA